MSESNAKDLINELGGVEKFEESDGDYETDGLFPMPVKRYRTIVENFGMSMEESYYWVLTNCKSNGYTRIDKIEDVFTSAENSSFFGASQQRLSAQQDKVVQFLATIGKMIKELFQIVREIRIIDEKLVYYNQSKSDNKKVRDTGDIVLKGAWIDIVEGGSKNPSSVYGLAREVGFAILPDLFFSTHPKNKDEVGKVVDALDFNESVKNVLKRKLEQFMVWKETTEVEIRNRRSFTVKYLRQHFDIIKMYMSWVRPYLKQIKRLHLDTSKLDRPEIIGAFETAMIEIEFIAKKPFGSGMNSVLSNHFIFHVRPQMSYQQEYQKGWGHVGKMEWNVRSYAWTDEQVKKYKELKAKQDLDLMRTINKSVSDAMDALGDDLMRYLKEAGEELEKNKNKNQPPKKKSLGEALFGDFLPKKKKNSDKELKKKLKEDQQKLKEANNNKSKAIASGKSTAYNLWKFYRKAHGLIMW